MRSVVVSGLALVGGVAADPQSLWGQCGGINWSGPTSCTSGATCTEYNAYYYQCIPGPTGTTSTTLATSTAKPTTTTTTTAKAPTTTTSVVITTTKLPTTTTTATTSRAVSSSTTSSAIGSSTGFPHAVGTLFNIDGKTHYAAGTNCYWIGFLTNNSDVDLAMSQMQSSGIKILRVWGFNDVNAIPATGNVWFQYLSASGSQINTGAYGLERLDYVVQSAQAHDIKLIINFVNNWNDYGGINAYVNAFGGNSTTWFTNAAAQAQYQTYIKAVVSRYASSPAVFAWELANEPRCHGCDTSVLYNWAATTSAYVKSLDSAHMVTLGDEGFGLPGDGSYPYTYGEGVDWVKNLGIPTLDFGTLHLYPSSWGTNDTWGNPWIQNHAKYCAQLDKPCFLEEYGMTSDHCDQESPWQQTSLSTPGMAGDAFWDFGTTLSSGKTSDDGNTIFYNTSDWTCLVTNHVAAINAS